MIYQSQFEFQNNKSTIHSLIEIVETIQTCIENKKAFDTVNHDILLQKLEIKSITCGVPQGSVLGPLVLNVVKARHGKSELTSLIFSIHNMANYSSGNL